MSLKVGTLRTAVQTHKDLEEQLTRALDGAPSSVNDMATTTGSKDKYFLHFIEKIQSTAKLVHEELKNKDHVPGTAKAAVKDALQVLCASLPNDIFNPTLRIPGELCWL